MERKKQTKDQESSRGEREVVDNLISVFIENLEEAYKNEDEAFESYVKRVKLQIFKKTKGLSHKILDGHQAIMNELDDKKNDSAN